MRCLNEVSHHRIHSIMTPIAQHQLGVLFSVHLKRLLLHRFWAHLLTCALTAYEYLTNLSTSKNYDRLLHFINEMKGTHDEKAGLDRWTQFFCVYAM